ncbi:ATP-binding cassette domain-containing protein [Lacticaseibacillus hulanensis]|uniref:ATP-binding cassette domain-containing protein n=1 Tax=Lacticaseibacillus hulanensis TaxID=2493111 RepID=UPI000FDAB6D2|nr:ABC transporter ATP-binding protein [Lacticaseibacillus hulanensis]
MEIKIDGLTEKIGHKQVLQNVNLTWHTGEILGLVGRNGAGKTTLMRTLTAAYQPDAGTVLLDGHNLAKEPKLRPHMVFLDDGNLFFGASRLSKVADFYATAYPQFARERFEQLINKNKLDLNATFNSLSKGNRAYVLVVLALATNAEFILLDEPFDGLDVIVREQILDLVIDTASRGDRTFMIASHNLAELDGLADRVAFLKHGTISQVYTLEDVRSTAVKMQLVFKHNELPDVVKQHGRIISRRGRVLEVIFPEYTAEISAALAATKPVMAEELPLQLTDLFKLEYRKTREGEIADA